LQHPEIAYFAACMLMYFLIFFLLQHLESEKSRESSANSEENIPYVNVSKTRVMVNNYAKK